MHPTTTGALAAVLLALIGVGVWRWLRTAGYRREDEVDSPTRRHHWVLAALPVAGFFLARALTLHHGVGVALACCATLPVLGALAAIDLDVHRLPNVLTYPLVPLALLVALVCSATTGSWFALLRAALGGLVLFVAYAALMLISPGAAGLGLGDVKMAAGLGVLLGWFGWSAVLGATLTAFILGGLWALVLLVTRRATRHTYLAFGPFMILGAVLQLLVS